MRLSALPEVARFLMDGTPWARADAEARSADQVRHWREHGFGWRAAADRATGELVGLMALSRADGLTPGVPAGEHEIGWWLDPAVWGRGLAREGAAAIRDEAFALGAPTIVARIQPENTASIAVAEALGLRRELASTGRVGEPLLVYRLARAD